jgi:hypothetical protein
MHIIRRVTDEAKEFSVIAVYLFVCFTALSYLKASILEAHGIEFAPFGFAAAKALICAKFILLGRALRAGGWFKSLPLIWPTLYNSIVFLSIVFLVLLLALNAGEEVAVGLFHHRNVAEAVAQLGGGTLHQLIATSVIVFLILIPFFAFRAIGEAVGAEKLARMFFMRSDMLESKR